MGHVETKEAMKEADGGSRFVRDVEIGRYIRW